MTERVNKQEKAIARRLDVIIRILLEEQRLLHKTSKTEQLAALHSAGLTPSEIGPIVGWEAYNVGSKLSKLRRKTIKKSEIA